MKIGPIAHGVLLIAVLAFGYQTWQRDKEVEPKTGTVEMWTEREADFESLQYDEENKSVRIEVRGEGDDRYLWGIVKTSRKAPAKPKTPPKKPEPPEDKKDGEDKKAIDKYLSESKKKDSGKEEKTDKASKKKQEKTVEVKEK